MQEDMVPQGLMGAFAREDAGGYRVRHAFVQDAGAVAVALAVAVVFILLVVGAYALIFAFLGDGDAQAVVATGVR